MKENNKKTDKQIIRALGKVCDILKTDIDGFCWLTHFVDYANVSQSLRIVVVFDTDIALSRLGSGLKKTIFSLVETQLETCGIIVADSEKAVLFDTEENGADVDSARWCRKY